MQVVVHRTIFFGHSGASLVGIGLEAANAESQYMHVAVDDIHSWSFPAATTATVL
jgi:hypothetical protein